ncbi:MAG: hypothetical protein WCJ30_08100, partial [Deltaproteobacteria bacterium]
YAMFLGGLGLGACERSQPAASTPATPPSAPGVPTPAQPIAPGTTPAAAATDASAPAAIITAAPTAADAAVAPHATPDAGPTAANSAPVVDADPGLGHVPTGPRAHAAAHAAPPSAASGEPAELRIRVVPSGQIRIDGAAVGEDLYRGTIPPGRHTIAVHNGDRMIDRTVTITLAPGEHMLRTIDLTHVE